MPAVGIEYRAVPGIEARRILQRPRRGLDRVERAAAAGEHGVAGVERHVEVGMDRAFVVGAELVALDDAGAAVDDQGDGTGMDCFAHRYRICDPHLPAGAHWGATSRDSDRKSTRLNSSH